MQDTYWNLSSDEVLKRLQTRLSGLKQEEVNKKQDEYGLNIIHKRTINILAIFIRQFKGNPLITILLIATTIAYLLGQHVSSYYIFAVTILSVLLGFWNEYSSEKTINDLLKKISANCVVVRNNEKFEVPVSQITVGDVILLSQGSVVPADLRVLECKNLTLNEAALTGESKPVYKTEPALQLNNPAVGEQKNMLFMGTVVSSGSGKAVVVKLGKDTEYGKISQSVVYTKPETDFQKALTKFGQLLLKVIIIFTVVIFLINALLGHPILDSILFALAIAVGLTPELLPVIVTVSLSHGAGKLAKKEVVVKQLVAIENFGNMDVLCTDKTGTLTEGKIELVDYFDASGKENPQIILYSLLCNEAVVHHKVIGEYIDVAIWEYALKHKIAINDKIKKLDEEPFDFDRRAMYTVVDDGKQITLIAKGAPEEIFSLLNNTQTKKLKEKFLGLSNEGYRVIAVGAKKIAKKKEYGWDDVKHLEFLGFVTFLDQPKKTAREALEKLQHLNVIVKVITGDNEIITKQVCESVGLDAKHIVLGKDIESLSEKELQKTVQHADIFAKTSPEQKLRIVKALQANGHTVGYLGDGINDIPPLHSADVGISVSSGVDVAKDTASVVLLRKSLDVIAEGIREGRKIFNNTIKYILMSTSSNFGNMFSASGASFFFPFLPMTPTQILLVNGLYDLSQTTIPSDNVDRQSLVKPRQWNIDFIRNYMIFFGPISSLYDFLTFGVMIFVFHAKGALFQTGWFVESLATEILIVFVIRTAKVPFLKSKPSKWLTITCLSIVIIGMYLPYSPLAPSLGFVPLPPVFFAILLVLVTTYMVLVEIAKKFFLRKYIL